MKFSAFLTAALIFFTPSLLSAQEQADFVQSEENGLIENIGGKLFG
jgi:hypothetical protein